ncbi:hypothetical protein [Neorhodopirellula pilleata]|uniref:Uncharacterized protein n=1 Tax=Neorhodopirellula pilleata TaxID=2714738 RepID=A0A5C6A124_9BACT|nr:hypothetical protein [Neorhodopirellula pilleata]TWT92253.1 hypothetical protein Pla100_47900 [Neorhodopirellula pilleata]
MRNLISNLNVIRDTRISGIVRNGFARISTLVADLHGVIEFAGKCMASMHPGTGWHTEIMPATHAVMPARFPAGPLAAAFGKPLHAIAIADQTCPSYRRLYEQTRQRECSRPSRSNTSIG